MFSGEDAFIRGLKSNPDQTAMLDALFRDPDFLRLWNYLKNCRAVTITLTASPGLTDAGGVERFGQYSPGTKTIELNPTKPEHVANASELVDTLVHELIHALCDIRDLCGEDDWPLPPGASDWGHDPTVPDPSQPRPDKASPESDNKQHARKHYGDGASDPDHEYLDENDRAQEFIVKIVTAVLKATVGGAPFFRLPGGPTLTFKGLKKLRGARSLTKNWKSIRAVTWESDPCWRRTSTARGWVMQCRCDWCEVIVKFNDGTKQIDLVDKGDKVELSLDSLHLTRLAGWED